MTFRQNSADRAATADRLLTRHAQPAALKGSVGRFRDRAQNSCVARCPIHEVADDLNPTAQARKLEVSEGTLAEGMDAMVSRDWHNFDLAKRTVRTTTKEA